MEKFLEWIGAIILSFTIIGLVCLLLSFPLMWLWNWLMPVIFGLTKINIWQSLGIMFLSSFLFKSGTTVKKD